MGSIVFDGDDDNIPSTDNIQCKKNIYVFKI